MELEGGIRNAQRRKKAGSVYELQVLCYGSVKTFWGFVAYRNVP